MGVFDSVDVEHNCPKCDAPMSQYQTKHLDCYMRVYRLGDAVKTEKLQKGSNFDFDLYDFCEPCGIMIEGTGVVRDSMLREVREKGYRDDRAPPILHPEDAFTSPRYVEIFGKYFRLGWRRVIPQEQPFVPNERIIAAYRD